jgi:hypothetical protein
LSFGEKQCGDLCESPQENHTFPTVADLKPATNVPITPFSSGGNRWKLLILKLVRRFEMTEISKIAFRTCLFKEGKGSKYIKEIPKVVHQQFTTRIERQNITAFSLPQSK